MAKEFNQERYADLWPVIQECLKLEPGESLMIACTIKSPHTVAQKLREFFRLVVEARPDLEIEKGMYSVAIPPEPMRVQVKKRKALEYGAFVIREDN